MTGGDPDLDAAFTYAWWLTGDNRAAVAAVRSAVQQRPRATPLPVLLREVRQAAVRGHTMCPASEVALLHDGQGLALDEAAGLVGVGAADARTELAHGRLEALAETVRDPFEHPERLGGLAVGNPADVAHARQCDSCATVRGLLDRGRDELADLAAVPVPADLSAAIGPAQIGDAEPDQAEETAASEGGARTAAAAAWPAVDLRVDIGAGDAEAADPADAVGPADSAGPTEAGEHPANAGATELSPPAPAPQPQAEPEVAPQPDPRPDPAASSRVGLWAGAAALLAGLAVVAIALAGSDPGLEPGAPRTTLPQPTAPTTPAAAAGFEVTAAGLLIGDDPTPRAERTVIAPDDPVLIGVDYRGATESVVLEGEWTAGGDPVRDLRVVLAGEDSRHVFGATAPTEGWPPGEHRVDLRADGEQVAVITFTVSD